ncbi:MAG: hypothetical protein LBG80_11340 [Bacteroidales bacterium]|jgi:hypothetical protein|nr:hypothetical protein [Bacteroidales bacterium]
MSLERLNSLQNIIGKFSFSSMRERKYFIHFLAYKDLLPSINNVARTHISKKESNFHIYIYPLFVSFGYIRLLSSNTYKKINTLGKSFILAIISRNIFITFSHGAKIQHSVSERLLSGAKVYIDVSDKIFTQIVTYQSVEMNIFPNK